MLNEESILCKATRTAKGEKNAAGEVQDYIIWSGEFTVYVSIGAVTYQDLDVNI